MEKQEFINGVVNEMTSILEQESLNKLKMVLAIKLSDFELTSAEKLPSTDVRGNEWILEKYWIDNIATSNKKSTFDRASFLPAELIILSPFLLPFMFSQLI